MAAPTFAVGAAPWETQPAPAAASSSFPVGQAPWETPPTPAPTPVSQPDTTQASVATFPAAPTDTALGGSAKLLGNIPASAVNFGKSFLNFINPLNTLKTIHDVGASAAQGLNEGNNPVKLATDTVAGLPAAAYQTLVPQFIQHIVSGDYQKAADTLRNDPVGQIAPLILIGRQAAESAGAGPQFDAAISKAALPVTATASAATGLLRRGVGAVSSQILGASTGAGASSIKQAFQASPAFTDALRGKVNPEDVVQTAQDAVANIAANRRSTYLSQLENIGTNTKSLNISPIQDTFNTQLKNFGIKVGPDGSLDFSRSSIANNGSARADVQGVYDTLKTWGTQTADRTPVGLDTLKKQLADFYSPSGSARALVQAVKSKVTGVLNEQVPGYSDMTSGYAKASQLLDEIKSATGAGGNAKVDTVFTKLTTALKADKALRLEVLDQMQAHGAQPDLMAHIAGLNMQSYIPSGLIGRGIDVGGAYAILGHFIDPSYIPMLVSTSPRIVGEFVRALGLGAGHTNTILKAINTIGGKLPTAAALAPTPQSNPAPAKQPVQ